MRAKLIFSPLPVQMDKMCYMRRFFEIQVFPTEASIIYFHVHFILEASFHYSAVFILEW